MVVVGTFPIAVIASVAQAVAVAVEKRDALRANRDVNALANILLQLILILDTI